MFFILFISTTQMVFLNYSEKRRIVKSVNK